MTRANLYALFLTLIREKSTNTSITTTIFNSWVDIAYQQFVADTWPELLTSVQTVTIPKTTVASKTSDTVWELTAGTNFAAGTEVCIHTGARFDFGRVSTISGTTLTLTSPGIPYAHTAGAIVVPMSVIITDMRETVNVNYKVMTSSKIEVTPITPISDDEMMKQGSYTTSVGTPNFYTLLAPTELRFYPVPNEAGYIDIWYRNKTEYSFSGDSVEPTVLDEDNHLALVIYCMALNCLRNSDLQGFTNYIQLYDRLAIRAISAMNRKRQVQGNLSFPQDINK